MSAASGATDTAGARAPNGSRGALRFWPLLVLAAAVALPYVSPNPYIVALATQAGIYAALALGLNMVVGFAGLLDLGYAAFFAVGAYGAGILSLTYHWPLLATIPAVILMAIIAGIIIGGPTLRLRSDYLAIVTLGFGEITRLVANNLHITGGATGLYNIPPVTFLGLRATSAVSYYFMVLALIVIYVFVIGRVRRSKIGRAWLALREDEDAASAMGIDPTRYKLYAYIGGAICASLVGAVYAPLMTAVAPNSFLPLQSILILVAVLLGGMGSVPGMIVGGGLVEVIPEVLRGYSEFRYLIFGLIMIALMIFRPQGVWPAKPYSPPREGPPRQGPPVPAGPAEGVAV